MDIIDLLDNFENHPIQRNFRDRSNPLEEFTEAEFIYRFRMSKQSAYELVLMLQIPINTHAWTALLPVQKLVITLNFYATGTFQRVISDLSGVHMSTISRVVHTTTQQLCRLLRQYVSHPNANQVRRIMEGFYAMSGFPSAAGALDCTHIRISKPADVNNPEIFRNRKGYYSVNVQACCSSDMTITDIVARWPGSTHDARIFDNSRLYAIYENGNGNGIILADNGYACRRQCFTPLLRPHTPQELRYNSAHKRARCVIERTFGVLKRRFPCLHIGLRFQPVKVTRVIIACVILHNFCIQRNDNIDQFQNLGYEEEVAGAAVIHQHEPGRNHRAHFINTRF